MSRTTRSGVSWPRATVGCEDPPGGAGAAVAGGDGSRVDSRGRLVRGSPWLCAGRLGLAHIRQRVEERGDLAGMVCLPAGDVRLGLFGNLKQQIHPAEQEVNLRLAQRELSRLRQGKTILHGMSHAHGGLEIDDARRPFERVGRPHEGSNGPSAPGPVPAPASRW